MISVSVIAGKQVKKLGQGISGLRIKTENYHARLRFWQQQQKYGVIVKNLKNTHRFVLFSSCRCVNETPAETCHRLAIRHEEEFIFRLTVPTIASIWLRTFNQSPCNIRINFVLGICVASYLFPAKDDFSNGESFGLCILCLSLRVSESQARVF